MAGLIKGQILKHLSKFVKNLSPNQISLSTLKGEGELLNLELNEVVLTELLELPFWIRLTKATCNRAAIRIQWTKLKTVPIQLNLDEIRVNLETCEELRSTKGESGGQKHFIAPQQSGAYGFTDKVVDGISVSVNLVYVSVSSLAFTASFQMSRILVESKTPTWQKANLQMTRLKDMEKGEVLVFKEMSWQTVRIEAKSTVSEELTPLRLITNQARFRITMKKRMSDSAILGCRLVLILDDLLWVLTDDQLKAALHFVDSISGLVKTATETTQKVKAARKLENQHSHQLGAGGPRQNSSKTTTSGGGSSHQQTAARTFQKYDVVETSYHFYTDRIDLHFCDDPGGGRSSHPGLAQGGAFQVSLSKLQMDYYPYHLARGDRRHWVRYSDATAPHRSWLHSNLAAFDTKLLDILLSGRNHTPLQRVSKGAGGGQSGSGIQPPHRGDPEDEAMRDVVVGQLSRLMTQNVVVRLSDVTVWCVATSSSPSSSGSKPQELCKGDSARLHLPDDLPLLHFEFTQFYYPGDLDFPLPPPALMLHMNPVTVWLDVLTVIWLNAFVLNLQKSVESLQASLDLEATDSFYADVKVELLMPRLVCKADRVISHQQQDRDRDRRPTELQLQASRVTMANYRSRETGSRADLAAVLEIFQQAPLFFGGTFPSRPDDESVVCEKFVAHATGQDAVKEAPSINTAFKKDLMWADARDMWYIAVDSCWAEFLLDSSSYMRPLPLVDALPLAAWLYAKPKVKTAARKPVTCDINNRPHRRLLMDYYAEASPSSDVVTNNIPEEAEVKQQEEKNSLHILAHTSKLVSVQLDHQQLIFLMRLGESLAEMSAFLSADTAAIEPHGSVVAVGAVLPQVDLSIILPIEHQPKASQPSPAVSINTLNGTLEALLSPLGVSPPCVSAYGGQSDRLSPAVASATAFKESVIIHEGPSLPAASTPAATTMRLEPVSPFADPLSATASPPCDRKEAGQLLPPPSPAPSPLHQAAVPPVFVQPLPPPVKLTVTPTLSSGGGAGRPSFSGASSPQRPRGSSISTSFSSIMDSMGLSSSTSSSYSHKSQEQQLYMGARSPDLDFDTLSVRSDDSGESSWDQDGFIVLGGEDDISDVLFSISTTRMDRPHSLSPAELAEEVYEASEELMSSISQQATGGSGLEAAQSLEDVLVTTVTLHLGRLQFAQLSGSLNSSDSCCQQEESSILLTIGSIGIDQTAAQSWQQFQNRFSASGKTWSDTTLCSADSWAVRLRLDSRPPAQPHLALAHLLPLDELAAVSLAERISRATDAELELYSKDLVLSFLSSTLVRLAEWGQDEGVAPNPLPLRLLLENITLHIEDDSSSQAGGNPPVDVSVPGSLRIARDRLGLVVISAGDSGDNTNGTPAKSQQHSGTRTSEERELRELRQQLEAAQTEARLLRGRLSAKDEEALKREQEIKAEKNKVREVRQEMEKLVLERNSLLDTLNYLQEELFRSGKKN